MELGTIRRGHELGYRTPSKHIWAECENCGQTRWVKVKISTNEIEHELCKSCAAKELWTRRKRRLNG